MSHSNRKGGIRAMKSCHSCCILIFRQSAMSLFPKIRRQAARRPYFSFSFTAPIRQTQKQKAAPF